MPSLRGANWRFKFQTQWDTSKLITCKQMFPAQIK